MDAVGEAEAGEWAGHVLYIILLRELSQRTPGHQIYLLLTLYNSRVLCDALAALLALCKQP